MCLGVPEDFGRFFTAGAGAGAVEAGLGDAATGSAAGIGAGAEAGTGAGTEAGTGAAAEAGTGAGAEAGTGAGAPR